MLQAPVFCYNNLYGPYLVLFVPYTWICKVEFSVHVQIMKSRSNTLSLKIILNYYELSKSSDNEP